MLSVTTSNCNTFYVFHPHPTMLFCNTFILIPLAFFSNAELSCFRLRLPLQADGFKSVKREGVWNEPHLRPFKKILRE